VDSKTLLRRAALASAVLSLSLAVPLVANAACGGVERAKATRHTARPGRPPLAIGDSTMLLALRDLGRRGFSVNARGCRQWAEGMQVIAAAKHRHHLPHLILIWLGADGTVTKSDIRDLMHLLPKRRAIALVTPRELGGGSGSDADVVRYAARRHSRRIMLLDWVRYSNGHSSWFQPDGLHLTTEGATAFAKFARHAMPYASPGDLPHGARYPH
jgi:hypothetical protein